MRFTPPCDNFDILSLFPPALPGGMCFEEDGEPDGGASEPAEEAEGNQAKGLQAAKAAETKRRQAAEQRAAELEQRLAEFESAQKKRDEEAAAKRGEFEKLYTDLKAQFDPLTEKLSAFEKREAARLEKLTTANAEALKALPENLRALVPEGLDEEAKAAQIKKLSALVDRETPRGGIPPRTPRGKKPAIPQECKDSATKHRKDPEKWFPIWLKTAEGRAWKAKQKS